MRKLIAFFAVCVIALFPVNSVSAADGKVTYDGNARNFVFEPGSEHSLTDLFSNFKSVMPGDTLTQQITVKNDAAKEIKAKIYIRSLGAKEDSVEFLSQLGLTVKKSEENEMAYMFDAAANETAGLTDWVCLGMLYSGGEVNLDVTLSVPEDLGNEFQDKVGYIDWEFKVEEFPAEPDDPKPPATGDSSKIILWSAVFVGSLLLLIVLFIWRKKDEEKSNSAVKH